MNNKVIKKELEWCGRSLTLETGKIANQADGSVLVTYGETTVLCTVVMCRDVVEGADFFPLNVHYKEMFFAAGKIPGGFLRREGKSSDREVVVSRLIDRPIRPLFPKGFHHDVQIICSVLSYDGENNPDIPALIGVSAALAISGVPVTDTIGAIRVGRSDGKFILNPIFSEEKEASDLDLVVAGTKDSILMVEALANELSEDQMIEAIDFAQKNFQPIIKLIQSFKKNAGKSALDFKVNSFDNELEKKIEKIVDKELAKILKIAKKKERETEVKLLRSKVFDEIKPEDDLKQSVSSIFKSIREKIVRKNILKGTRIDGRGMDKIRPITSEVSILPRTHGSALFTRGETQALVVTTLGGSQDEQIIDSISTDTKEHFLLHYNFPPYSVGETGFMRGPGRREIGHGKLAWKAVYPMLPSKEEFPYTIRVVSEITECNGSSSMATVCGTTLALMDAGVPLKAPVAGIAMGLVKEGAKFKVLSDIIGDEDSLGDMDFKVAGTANGITALQMDIKIPGITQEIMKIALKQAKEGRLSILNDISKALAAPRDGVSKFAPSIVKIPVKKDKIGSIVGPGGKTIKDICAKTGAKVDISDDGVVSITALSKESSDKAIKMVTDIAIDPELGTIYEGIVKEILDFGAVVRFLNREGLLHISEISHKRITNINDVLKVDERIKVKLVEMDQYKGKYRLSIKSIDDEDTSKQDSHIVEGEKTSISSSEGLAVPEEEDEINYNREGTSYESRAPRNPRFKKKNRGVKRNNNNRDNTQGSWRRGGDRPVDGRKPKPYKKRRQDFRENTEKNVGEEQGSSPKKKYFNI